MSDAELDAFLAEQMVMQCATVGPRGLPHLVPLWYLVRDGRIWAWTYAKSQKVVNLERDARATLQVEAGTEYHELRGVMLECDVQMDRDPSAVERYGLDLFSRYAGDLGAEVRAMVTQQAQKRVGLTFVPSRVVSWDHRKLAGGY